MNFYFFQHIYSIIIIKSVDFICTILYHISVI